MKKNRNAFLLTIGLLLLFGAEICRVYFIMPFLGSQQKDTIGFAYWLGKNIFWIRLLAIAFIIGPSLQIFRNSKRPAKISLALLLIFYGVIFYFINFRFEADKMFYQPKITQFILPAADTASTQRLVIGIVNNGEAKAYPIEVIGYHHQVRDSIGGMPVMVTYCTVCRTGRVFSPFVDGKLENFRLVGTDHFNAMFEDVTTKSWWQQATGVAVAGPLKGKALKEIPSVQLPLKVWLRKYPGSRIMLPDSNFRKNYAHLAGYDNGTIKDNLEKRDSASWKMKSWVIGIVAGNDSKAYDWNELQKQSLIQDSVGNTAVLLTMENDNMSFHVFNRVIDGKLLKFEPKMENNFLRDETTGSEWNLEGECVSGEMKGKTMMPVQSYNEFWHSWKTFHPATAQYLSN